MNDAENNNYIENQINIPPAGGAQLPNINEPPIVNKTGGWHPHVQ